MNSNRTFLGMILLSVSLFLTWFMGVLAAFPLLPARIVLGPRLFWAINFTVSAVLLGLGKFEWGGIFVILTVLLGSFSEFESRGDSLQSAGVSSILVTLIVAMGVVGVGYALMGSGLFTEIKGTYEAGFTALNGSYSQLFGRELLNEEALLALKMQSPSFLIMAMIIALFFGLLGESRLLNMTLQTKIKKFYRINEFRVHDVVIWTFIASMLGSFWQFNNEWVRVVSTNLLNVSVLLLFLQGLAVISKFFQVFRVGTFWRVFWTILLIVQLSIGIVLLGLTDYWLDFRSRMKKHATAIKEGQKKHSGRK